MASKIESSLTPEQLQEFFHRCAQLKGTKLADIAALAAEFGIDISIMSAKSFRDGDRWQAYLAELKRKREQAESIAEIAKQGLGLADAAAVKLAVKINDDLDRDEDLSMDDKNAYSLAISRLRTGDQRARFLEAKLQEMQQQLEMQQFDAATAVLAHAAEIKLVIADKSLDASARTDRVRKILFGERPANWKPVTDKGAPVE